MFPVAVDTGTRRLVVAPVNLSTVASRAFPVPVAVLYNGMHCLET